MRWLVIACGLAALACGSGSSGGAASPQPTVAKPAPPKRLALAPSLAFIPADTQTLVRLDLAAIRKSSMWPWFHSRLARIAALVPACKPSLLDGVTTLVVAVPRTTRQGDPGVIASMRARAIGTIPRSEMVGCIREAASLSPLVSAERNGDGVRVGVVGSEGLQFRWGQRAVEVGRDPRSWTPAARLDPRFELRALLQRIERDSMIWIAIGRMDQQNDGDPEVGTIQIQDRTDGLAVKIAYRFANVAAARKKASSMMADLAKQLSDAGLQVTVAELGGRIEHAREGRWVSVDVFWTEAELRDLLLRLSP